MTFSLAQALSFKLAGATRFCLLSPLHLHKPYPVNWSVKMFARQIFRPARQLHQQVRRYASDAPKPGSTSVLYTGIGAAGLAGAYLYMRGGDSPSGQQGNAPPSAEESKIPAVTGEAKKAFIGGDQGFLSLVLEKSEIVNHNTKKLTFKLPEEDQESGLPVACTLDALKASRIADS